MEIMYFLRTNDFFKSKIALESIYFARITSHEVTKVVSLCKIAVKHRD